MEEWGAFRKRRGNYLVLEGYSAGTRRFSAALWSCRRRNGGDGGGAHEKSRLLREIDPIQLSASVRQAAHGGQRAAGGNSAVQVGECAVQVSTVRKERS